ncbi:hypothetical protein [Bacillus dakarensis]|uniref:hypothetical protein n=1 Tax=Robertmurraya dakarensis TaxID=1926278 RepID=UPI000981AD94|nr:hypothetical protein [Bacillus dakarensis]
MAENKVIAGEYEGGTVQKELFEDKVTIDFKGEKMMLDKTTVEHYDILDETSRKSAISAMGRGLAGAVVLGPVGLLAGLSAKSKSTHTLAIQFKDGKKSLIDIDKKIYSVLLKRLF